MLECVREGSERFATQHRGPEASQMSRNEHVGTSEGDGDAMKRPRKLRNASEAQYKLDEPDNKTAIPDDVHTYQERDNTRTWVTHAISHRPPDSLLIMLTRPIAFRLVRRLCGSEG